MGKYSKNRLRVRLGYTAVLVLVILQIFGCSGRQTQEEETQAPLVHDVEAETVAELSYSASDREDWDKALSENQISKDFSDALNSFSFTTAGTLLHKNDENQVFSPLSVYHALAMAESGAADGTKEEIDSLLGIKDSEELVRQFHRLLLSLSYEQQEYKTLARERGAYSYNSDISLSGSLWFSRTLTVDNEFLEKVSKDFLASSYAVNFDNPDSKARIEYWFRDMTKGAIYPRIDLPVNTAFAITDTIAYCGAWEMPFAEENTVEDIFTPGDGSANVTVSYCRRTEPWGSTAIGGGYMSSSLKLDNGCEMVVFLPDEEHTVDEFLSEPDKLRIMMGANFSHKGTVEWKIPKFSFGSSCSLSVILKKLGVTSMFGSSADFSKISDEDLKVSEILHEAHIFVDERGVEGAAASVGETEEMIPDADAETYEMFCERPFIFGIRSSNTGVWLLLGVCRNPAE